MYDLDAGQPARSRSLRCRFRGEQAAKARTVGLGPTVLHREARPLPWGDAEILVATAGESEPEVVDDPVNMAVRVAAAHKTDRIRGFDERPLEVALDVGAVAPVRTEPSRDFAGPPDEPDEVMAKDRYGRSARGATSGGRPPFDMS